MEAAAILALVGAVVGAAIAIFWACVDLLFGTHTLTEARAVGLIGCFTVGTPAALGVVFVITGIMDERRARPRPKAPPRARNDG